MRVVQVAAGGWNLAFVRQSDGVVMIEAPWSTGYTKRAPQDARTRFGMPGPVKGVITTSDSWPHIAGVRQARLVRAPHAQRPDDDRQR